MANLTLGLFLFFCRVSRIGNLPVQKRRAEMCFRIGAETWELLKNSAAEEERPEGVPLISVPDLMGPSVDVARADSCEEDELHTCESLNRKIVSRRNMLFLAKHGLEVQKSAQESVGMGLFAGKQLRKDSAFPLLPHAESLGTVKPRKLNGSIFMRFCRNICIRIHAYIYIYILCRIHIIFV